MRKSFIIITLSFFFLSCSSQSPIVKNISENVDLNYILSNIWKEKITEKTLWNGGQYLRVFEISDSKATPENFFEGSDEVLSSLISSSTPDGDYYTNSKLYKIEGLIIPKVLEIQETKAPDFLIKNEHDSYGDDKRKVKTFEFKGVQ